MTTPQPHDLIYYPIPQGGEGCLHIFHNGSRKLSADGDDKSSSLHDCLVLVCPGFPDDQRGFAPLANRLVHQEEPNQHHLIVVGVMCLPGYEDPATLDRHPDDGYTFDDWADTVRAAAEALRSHHQKSFSSSRKRRVVLTGIFHDWGVLAGLLWHNREDDSSMRLDRIVLLDVLPQLHPQQLKTNAVSSASFSYNEFCIHAYQFCFAINFWLYQHVPRIVVFAFQFLTEWTLTATKCFPVSADDYQYLKRSGILPVTMENCQRLGYMSYPYRNIRRLRNPFSISPPCQEQPFPFSSCTVVPNGSLSTIRQRSSG